MAKARIHPISIGGTGRLDAPAGPVYFPETNGFSLLEGVRGAGVEPASQAWKAGVLPLDHPRAVGDEPQVAHKSAAREPISSLIQWMREALRCVHRPSALLSARI